MDFYKILGVTKSATDKEIKQAYRRLASKHHPDKGGDTKKFQEIQKAYDVLSDPNKRKQYDNPNPFTGFHQGHGSENFEDLFKSFFNKDFAHHSKHQARKNRDIRATISVDLASTLTSQTKTVSIQTTNGQRHEVVVEIPRGIKSGTTIKYAQQGDNFFESLTRGDLYVIVNVIEDKRFKVEGNNIVVTIDIDAIDAIIGTKCHIKSLDEKTFMLTIPSGTQPATKFKLKSQGLYALNSVQRGDLIVDVNITIPTLSEQQIAILKTVREK